MRKKFLGIIVVLILLLMGQVVHASGVHVVQRGNTLWLIAQRYNTTVNDLVQANSLNNANYIEVGQRLSVPGGGGTVHTVRPGDTLWIIANQYNTTVAAIAGANGITNTHYIEVGQRLVISGESSVQLPSRGGFEFSAADLDLFARLVHAEAAGEPFVGQVAVAASVLNRIRDSRYPNTLRAVIYQVSGGYYQYSPVLDGRINLPANESARRAVRDAVNGSDPSLGATGFYNPRKTSNVWVRQQPVTTVIANHVFFR